MTETNSQIHLVSRPTGEPSAENFQLVTQPAPSPQEGEVLLRTVYLSLDPYMRARMYEAENYAASAELNAPMGGDTVSQVVESRLDGFAVGDYVVSNHGWQTYAVSTGRGLTKIDPNIAPPSTALSVLGMPGMTAYGALLRHGKPRKGDTLVVSAASGAVGSVVGQVARMKGVRVVGLAGGTEKCAYLTNELGFDAAIDHRSDTVGEQLAEACPYGVDIYYDNVAGDLALKVLPLFNMGGRYLVCGTIAVNRGLERATGPDHFQEFLATILVKRLTVQGFIFPEFMDMAAEFREEMSGWIRSGAVKYREHVVEGLENAPEAFIGLFTGQNFGKLLIKV